MSRTQVYLNRSQTEVGGSSKIAKDEVIGKSFPIGNIHQNIQHHITLKSNGNAITPPLRPKAYYQPPPTTTTATPPSTSAPPRRVREQPFNEVYNNQAKDAERNLRIIDNLTLSNNSNNNCSCDPAIQLYCRRPHDPFCVCNGNPQRSCGPQSPPIGCKVYSLGERSPRTNCAQDGHPQSMTTDSDGKRRISGGKDDRKQGDFKSSPPIAGPYAQKQITTLQKPHQTSPKPQEHDLTSSVSSLHTAKSHPRLVERVATREALTNTTIFSTTPSRASRRGGGGVFSCCGSHCMTIIVIWLILLTLFIFNPWFSVCERCGCALINWQREIYW